MKMLHSGGFAAAYCVAMMAYAASITVPNFSFENPDVADGAAVASIPGWTVSVSPFQGSAGVYDHLNTQYAGATGNNSPLPRSALGSPDGGQTAFISLREGQGSLAIDDIGSKVEANTRYVLTVALGNRLDANPGNITIRLMVNSTHLGGTGVLGSIIPNGAFQDYETELGPFTSGDSRIGGTLGIELLMTAPQSTIPELIGDFDNVRLIAVPEPAAIGMLLMTCLLCQHRPRARLLYRSARLT